MRYTVRSMSPKGRRNKGFSLIELIIVIAILAVLVAVLTPQLLKYVERSREAKDRANVYAVYRAFQLAVMEPGVEVSGGGSDSLVPGAGAPITYHANGELKNIGPTLKRQFKNFYGEVGQTADTNNIYYLPPLTSKKYQANPPVFRFRYNGGSVKDFIVVTYSNPVS